MMHASKCIAILTSIHIHVHTCIDSQQCTFLAPGGVGSNILACISEGRLAYIGSNISSPIRDPNLAVRSYFNIQILHHHSQSFYL